MPTPETLREIHRATRHHGVASPGQVTTQPAHVAAAILLKLGQLGYGF